ncbi:MAG: C4-type zinc ribbon domain-containing protein [Microbacteriaceae bacterium]|nr:C4-type zinc ribbon domain-containing protein [Microbacteriaceae bacterium]HPZ34870.1 C4-type zinc ribbon domain-containing protein [Microbacteriaceae bacterium]HQC92310.1 C4-type zinc ribbon domain-containing protein [Microbacteriaceae bacterium]
MNASPNDQKKLLDIADLDVRLRQAEHRRTHPPQAARIAELAGERTARSHELAAVIGARDDIKSELGRLESDVALAEARRERNSERLAASTNAKDAQALETELAQLARRLSELEDAELIVMERLEQADADVDATQALIDQLTAEGTQLTLDGKAAVADASTLIDALQRDRGAVIEAIPADLVALYEKAAVRSAGAALLQRKTCLGCHMELSGTDLQQIRQASSQAIVHCPECGSILIRTEESGL